MQLKKNLNLKINDFDYHIHLWGNPSSPPLFLLHGWMDSGANFEFVAEILQQHFYCIAPDLRGHGQTSHTTNPLGYFFLEYLADINLIFDHFQTGGVPLKVVGHSMGGNILSLYAGSFPDRISHFVSIEGLGIGDMCPQTAPRRVRSWIQATQEKPHRTFSSFGDYINLLQMRAPMATQDHLHFFANNLIFEKEGAWHFRADLRHTLPGPYLSRLDQNIAFWREIKAKVLYIQGEKTNMKNWLGTKDKSEEEFVEELSRRLSLFPSGTEKKVISDVGHMVHYENPVQLATEILGFLTNSASQSFDR